ncbi:MAG: GNAT family N-acetyltransferase [Acidobacteria bacterium]|nr:GNAT family N-acetyltransferase [Acidobacteriota bacterium]
MEIREAHDEDWPKIYPIFRAVVEEGKTYAFPENLSLEEARPWWMEKSPAVTVVASEGDIVLGSAKMGPNRPGRGSHIATASFMVNPARQGKGVGTALGNYAIEWARVRGYRGMQFNAVVETNEPAVHLWKKLGFEVLTTVPEAFGHPEYGFVGLHVMYRNF